MAIAFSTFASTDNAAPGTSIVINKPTGVVNGDLMFAVISFTSGSETISSAPAGWTLIQATSSGGANQISLSTYYRIASGEGASYTWNYTGSGINNCGFIIRITGAHATTPYDVSSGTYGQGGVATGSGISSSFNDSLVCFVVGYQSDQLGWSFTTPIGYTSRVSLASSGAAHAFGCDKIQTGAGNTGSPTTSPPTAISTDWWAAQMVVFRPPVAAANPMDGQTIVTDCPPKRQLRRTVVFTGFLNEDAPPAVILPFPPTCWTENPPRRKHIYRKFHIDVPLAANSLLPPPSPNTAVVSNPGKRISLLPGTLADDAQWKRQAAAWMNEVNQGHMQNTGIFTLAANQAQTVVTDKRVGANSHIGFMARTANAAAELASGNMYVSSQGKQTFVVTHSFNAQTDRTFVYTILG